MLTRIAVIAAALVAGYAAVPAAAQRTDRPIHIRDVPRRSGELIPGRYIITVVPRISPVVVASAAGARPDRFYQRVLNGFVATLSDEARKRLLGDPRVIRVEQDRMAHITGLANSWGLDRIDQRILPLNNSYTAPATGLGVTAFVVDTGIRFDHTLFGGRAVRGIDMINDGYNGADCHGHGTHVAGTIGGGAGYGVAPDATLVSVRVLNCSGSGSVSGIIAALDWIKTNARRPAVVNMSLGGTVSTSLDNAVNSLVASGITTVVAAGNDNLDACQHSPARAASAVTVAASDKNDLRASFSNWGSCVDLFAPGVSIASAYKTSATSIALMSGTSMAAPHTAGRAALLLEANPTMTTSAVTSAILSSATTNLVQSAAGSPNRLLYTGVVAASEPPPPAPTPTAITLALSTRVTATGQPVVTIRWVGATSSSVDIYRNGAKFINTPNDGVHSDRPSIRGTLRYKVCNVGSSSCSAESSVTI